MGSDGTIRVTGADLEGMASDMRSANSKIADRLDTMHGNLMKIFGDNWTGDAEKAYQAAKVQWDKQIADMNQIMQDAHNNVLSSKESYLAADKKAASFF